MELTNDIAKLRIITSKVWPLNVARGGVVMLSPIAPHFCHTLWQALGNKGAVIDASWPAVDKTALIRDRLNW